MYNESEFRTIDGYAGLYEVNSIGDVRSLGRSKTPHYKPRPRILKPDILKFGYLQVTLYFNGSSRRFKVHRLVAKAFIPNPDRLPMVNHKDSNPSNNHVSNLEWCTAKQNGEHAAKAGRMQKRPNEKNPMCRLTNQQVSEIILLRKSGLTLTAIANQYDVSFQHISKIINGTRRRGEVIDEVPVFEKRQLINQ